MNFCQEISFLPNIPNNLIKDLKTIETYKDHFSTSNENFSDTYTSREVNLDLHNYIQTFFNKPIKVRYQIIKKELPIHVDKTYQESKLNYIIDTGGDVKTMWWTSIKEPRNIIQEHTLENNKWYRLNIQTPHSITIPERPRISVTVKEI